MGQQFCQSCGMDMVKFNEAYGTNADGSLSEDYCQHCYSGGEFTSDITMDAMVAQWAPYLIQENPLLTEEDAVRQIEPLLSGLKRWNQ